MKSKKLTFYTEIAYLIGLFFLAFGTALTVYGGFGMSMVVAPAYIIHKFVEQFWSPFSFAMAEYIFQAILLILLMIIIRKAKWSYILSFGSVLLYGFFLSFSQMLTQKLLPQSSATLQIIMYVLGIIIICMSVALLFTTYIPLEAYEMFVKEISAKLHVPIPKVKIFYDCASLLVAMILCTIFFNPFSHGGYSDIVSGFMAYGIGNGTVACAFINGPIIGLFQKLYSKIFNFEDAFKLRKYFEDTNQINTNTENNEIKESE